MEKEIKLSEDTKNKLRQLFQGFNTFGNKADMYSLCINKFLKPGSSV